jgi:hypothetical protein
VRDGRSLSYSDQLDCRSLKYQPFVAKMSLKSCYSLGTPQPTIEKAMYPVQVVLGNGSVVIRLGEIMEWFEHRGIEPRNIQYRMAADHISLRVDLAERTEATAFAEAFAGSVGGVARRQRRSRS